MKLTVVGCSGSYPGPDASASCYLVEADDGERTWRILLDLGNGSLGVLQRFADALSIDAVLVSHLHADHCLDLCGYYVMRKYHPQGPQPRIPVYGPAGIAARMARAYELPEVPGMTEEFDFREYDGGFSLGPFDVAPIRVEHPVEAYGLRVTAGGATLGYSGDTAPCEGLDAVASGAQVLLCEASFRHADDNPPGIHVTGVDAGAAAARGGAERLVLTHIPPWFDRDEMVAEARTTYPGHIDLAHTGAVFTF